MKKIVKILNIAILLIISLTIKVNAESDTFDLKLKVENNKNNEEYSIYLLLPERYIEYAIMEDDLIINTEGKLGDVLKDNYITSIPVEQYKIKEIDYVEDNIRYAQILLEPNKKRKL